MGGLAITRQTDAQRESHFLEVCLKFLDLNKNCFNQHYSDMSPTLQHQVYPYSSFPALIAQLHEERDPDQVIRILADLILYARLPSSLFQNLASLYSLMREKRLATFDLLRICWYLYRTNPPQELYEELKSLSKILQTDGRITVAMLVHNELVPADRVIGLGCYLLTLAILRKKHEGERNERWVNRVLMFSLNNRLIALYTGLLYYWESVVRADFPELSHTQIENLNYEGLLVLLKGCADQSEKPIYMEPIYSRLTDFQLEFPDAFLTPCLMNTGVGKLTKWIRENKSDLLHKALRLEIQVTRSVKQKLGISDGLTALKVLLEQLEVKTLAEDKIQLCADEFCDLFNEQVAYSYFDPSFCSVYFSKGKDLKTVKTAIRERVLYAATQHGTTELVEYLTALIPFCYNEYEPSKDGIARKAILNCRVLFPSISQSLLESADKALQSYITRRPEAKGEKLLQLRISIAVVEKLIFDIKEAMQLDEQETTEGNIRNKLIEYADCVFENLDESHLGKIGEECKRNMGAFQLDHISLEQYSDLDSFESVIWSLLDKQIEKLLQKRTTHWSLPSYVNKWKRHADLLKVFCEFDFFHLIFRPSVPELLRRVVFSIVIVPFMKKKELLLEDRNECLLNWKLTMVRIALKGFVAPQTPLEKNMICTITRSTCVNQALTSVGIFPRNLHFYEERVFYTDLGFNILGMSIYGGFILINILYNKQEEFERSVAMVTLAHELAHASRRYQTDFINIEVQSPIQQGRILFGMPGKDTDMYNSQREGGYYLESELFGMIITHASAAQVKFLATVSNWNLNLTEFKQALVTLGEKAKPEDRMALARAESGIYYLRTRRDCITRC